jgi:hypothetical protein
MQKFDKTWTAINNLITMFPVEQMKTVVDNYYLKKFNNPAPGELLVYRLMELQKLLNEAPDAEGM